MLKSKSTPTGCFGRMAHFMLRTAGRPGVYAGVTTSGRKAMATIQRYYTTANDRRIHYRRGGDGPPLVMMHASSGSSLSLQGLAGRLAERYSVIAIDTPGYGESAPLELEVPETADFADALSLTLDALNVPRASLYGSHTGANIAMEFAIRHPHRVHRLVLNGLGAYTPEEQQWLLDNYIPFFIPASDGSHLVQAWTMRRDMSLFRPWFNRTQQGRLSRDMPSPDQIHDSVVDLLRGGNNYRKGYRAAFCYDGVGSLQKLTVPTALLTRENDPLNRYLEQAGGLPANIASALVEDTQENAVVSLFFDFLAQDDALPKAPPPPSVPFVRGRVRRDYITTSAGQLLMRKSGDGPERPLIMFHSSPRSSAGLEHYLLQFGDNRQVVTFDNPCNGDSAGLPGTPEIGDIADVLIEAIDQLGWDEYDLWGTHTGAMIAIDVGIKRPDKAKHVILDGITMYSPERTAEILENYPIPLKITSDGSHMIWAWNQLRDMALFFPWYDKTAATSNGRGLADPEQLHASFMEYIKGGRTYHKSYRAAFAYPTRDRLPLLAVPTLHCAAPTDPLREFVAEGVRLTPNAHGRITEGTATPEALSNTLSLWRAFLADRPLLESGTVA
jgi:pimeloyl-ACP methyl ester carboxylesterase